VHPRMLGIDGARPVQLIEAGGLSAVVSEHNGEPLTTMPKEGLVRALLSHQRVVEGFLSGRAVLPARFGTVLAGTEEVLALLQQSRAQLFEQLESLWDRVEVEVAATWDLQAVLAGIGRDEEVVRVREAMSPEAAQSERLRLGRLVKAKMDQRRDSYREVMVAALKPLAVDVNANALVSDMLVMNVAFLIESGEQAQFDQAVEGLDRRFQDEITFRVIGPLPPYSFSTLEVERVTPEEVQEAAAILQLSEARHEAEVRRAYRRLAAKELRGSRGNADPSRLSRLRESADCMQRYLRARGRAVANGWKGMGDGPLLSVTVRRLCSENIEPASFAGVTAA